ncbi:MAG: chromosomal replication initiator protein DnaA [bacterium]
MTASSVWAKACKHLSDTLSKDVFDRWISVIEVRELNDEKITLSVQNNFYQSWLEENYLSLIQTAVTAACGRDLKIDFQIDRTTSVAEISARQLQKPVEREKSSSHQRPAPALNPKYTFDTFVVGPSNSFSHAASLAVAQSPGRAYNPLFLYGGVGLGKTHLMQAIGQYVASNHKVSISYISCETFTNEYIDALQKKALVQFRKKYRNVDVLLIDDIQFLGGKERMQEEFFHTFNALFDNHKQIVMTCDRPASEIPGLEHRLVSRFEWGLVTELEPPDVETRIAILRKKQEQLNLHLPDEVVNYLAEHIRSNIRRLEGALIRAVSYSSLTGRPLTIDVLEYLLRDTLDQEQENILTVEEIQKVVADYFDLRMGDMTSNRRPRAIAFPRQVAMYLCREMTGQSLPSIGTAFGRNHATIMHGCGVVKERLKADPSFRQSMMVLQQRLAKKT